MTVANPSESRRIAILQSCYIPWKGYFDIIGSVDTFVLYDDVQYSKNHWHNRNLVKTQAGTQWLTIPVSKASGSFQPIDSVLVSQPFAEKHWRSIQQSYAHAPYLARYRNFFRDLYTRAAGMDRLSEINLLFIEAIARELGFDTRFVWSDSLSAAGAQTDRLVAICRELEVTSYLTGPAAASYLQQEKFDRAGISLEWMNYADYPAYPQLHGAFAHNVSVIDLLLNTGPDARSYMKAPHGGR